MNNEQAIKRIKERICCEGSNGGVYYICDDSCMYGEYECEFALAIKALEKQIPKKPIPITRNEHSKRIIGYGCPNCHKDITGIGLHCWNCGQAIDWRDE